MINLEKMSNEELIRKVIDSIRDESFAELLRRMEEGERAKIVLVQLLATMGVCNDCRQTIDYLAQKATEAGSRYEHYKQICDGHSEESHKNPKPYDQKGAGC
jgi:hypothetical protein